MAFLSMCVRMKRTEYVCGEKVRRFTPMWAIIVFLPLIIWTGYRGWVGDTGQYMRSFAEMPFEFSGIPAYMEAIKKDKGFYFCAAIIKSIIGDKVELYFIIIACVQVYFLAKVYRKYSTNYLISFFLFIASTDYISWMFNGIRQFVAVTITLFAFDYILERKYVKAIIIIVIASLFHQSALLVIPFVFLIQGKAWNKKTLFFIVLIIFAVTFVEQFTGLLDNMLEETQYTNVVSDWQSWEDDGTNVIRVLVYSIPTILSLIGLRYIRRTDDPIINICTNMSIVSAGFYVVSMFTSGIFIGRLPIYFSLYNYVLLPWEIDNMFEKKSAKILYGMMIVAYLLFYYYQVHLTWGVA